MSLRLWLPVLASGADSKPLLRDISSMEAHLRALQREVSTETPEATLSSGTAYSRCSMACNMIGLEGL